MKLRDLIKYNQLVNNLDDKGMRANISSQLSALDRDLSTHAFDIGDIKEKIVGEHLAVMKHLENISDNLKMFRKNIADSVKNLEKPYFKLSNEIYKTYCKQSPENKLDRFLFHNLLHNDKTRKLLHDRIRLYIKFEYPAMQIGPADGQFTEDLIAMDPLYIVDEHEIMFKHVKKLWTKQFQTRLRYYAVQDAPLDPFIKLPKSQLGLIVAIDYLNLKPFDIIEKYLTSFYKMLKPGGVVIFTYNNCYYPKGIDNVDNMLYCYNTEEKVTNFCTHLGFNILNSINKDYDERKTGISWLEIQKPGELSSIKGGQTLGAIKYL